MEWRMEAVSEKTQLQLEKIKKNIKQSYDGNKHNYDMFNEFKRFIFQSSLSAADMSMLDSIGRPQLEFNILPAYIARLQGEFSKQEPAVEVVADKPEKSDPQLIEMIDDHLQYVFNDSSNEHLKYNCYGNLLTGGWAVMKIGTEYSSEMSMDQVIKVSLPKDPTLCGFDLNATETHKGDGNFCFEFVVWTKEEFKEHYPNIDLTGVTFRDDFEGFRWSYQVGSQEIILVADYFKKKRVKIKIALLDDNRVVTMSEYKKITEEWTDITMPPSIIGKPRETTITKICRYRLIENKILEYEETDYPGLPLVFFQGNASMVREEGSGKIKHMCLPYIYHARDAQRLKNYAGISLANEMENILQHKFSVAIEALPTEQPDWLEAYTNVQKANVLVHKTRYDDNPEMMIPNPVIQLQKTAAPPEIMAAFQGSDSAIQQALGSYDASLGINDNQLSGIAVVEAASQSNAAAMPYVVGFMQGLQRIGQLYVDLMPKYMVTPRTIPLRNKKGERYYQNINKDKDPTFNYESNDLKVHARAGASFQVQKSRTLSMVKDMMGMSPIFSQFIAEKGLNFVLENMEGKGIEQLKEQVDSFVKDIEKQKQSAQQQQQQNPALMRIQVDQQKLQFETQKMQMQHKIDMLKLQQEHHKIDAEMLMSHNKDAMDIERAKLDYKAKMADTSVKSDDMIAKHIGASLDREHKHAKETFETINLMSKNGKDNEKKST